MDRSFAPVPLRQFVLKVASRCDLACDHCYVYEHADSSWRGRPMAVSGKTLRAAADRIAEHAGAHGLETVHVVLHGGEPLLAGPERLRTAAEELRRALDGVCALDLRIHTNGVRLDERFCELFAELDIKVGVSLDGDEESNDRHRRYADGRGSHREVLRAVALLNRPRYRHLFAGVLCTIDVANDPVAVYDALAALNPPRVDFLLPHATHDTPPPRPDGSPTAYADWLAVVHERWTGDGRPMEVRVFESVERTLRGESSLTESLGLAPVDLAVIETDGTFEQADSLKTAYDGAPVTGMDVFANTLDELAAHPGVTARQQGLDGLCEECRACPVVTSCGGGLYAHRYRSGRGFDNPSVYCADLKKLVETIHDRTPAPAPAVPSALTDGQLAELAAGYGGAEAVAELARTQLDINRMLVAEVWRATPQTGIAAEAWELLGELDSTAPQALDTVLAHPYTRAWAVRCLGRAPGQADAGGLAEIAAAAAVRAGLRHPVRVPVRGGVLRLPTIGAVLVDGAGEAHTTATGADGFTVRAGDQEFSPTATGEADPRWQPLRRVGLPGWSVALEDTDPHRDSHQWPVAPRLDAAEAAAWRSDLADAWELIRAELPAYAPGLAAGLGTVTPLRAPDSGDVSAAARDGFGAVGAARPASPDILALLLVHEFQHVKLGALLDLHNLHTPETAGDSGLYYAPWRPDPRPLEGLLQGTYAHIAVTDFWRVRRTSATGAAAHEAATHFVRWRDDTLEAVGTLHGSGRLTPLGRRFADAMRATLEGWLDEPVAAAVVVAARRSSEEHRAQGAAPGR